MSKGKKMHTLNITYVIHGTFWFYKVDGPAKILASQPVWISISMLTWNRGIISNIAICVLFEKIESDSWLNVIC